MLRMRLLVLLGLLGFLGNDLIFGIILNKLAVWSGRQDLNLRPLRPKRSALPTVPRPDGAILAHFQQWC